MPQTPARFSFLVHFHCYYLTCSLQIVSLLFLLLDSLGAALPNFNSLVDWGTLSFDIQCNSFAVVMPHSFQSHTSSSDSSSSDDMLLDTTNDSWRTSSPVQNVEAPYISCTSIVLHCSCHPIYPKVHLWCDRCVAPQQPKLLHKSCTTAAPASPSPPWESPAWKA